MIKWNFFPVWYSSDLNIQPNLAYKIPYMKKNVVRLLQKKKTVEKMLWICKIPKKRIHTIFWNYYV